MISATSNINTVRDSNTVMPGGKEDSRQIDEQIQKNKGKKSFIVVFSFMVTCSWLIEKMFRTGLVFLTC